MEKTLEVRRVRPEDRWWHRGTFDRMIAQLKLQGAMIEPDRRNAGAFEYIIEFPFEARVMVTITLMLKEWQTTSDVVITQMTTLPEAERSKGFGGRALAQVVAWATRNKLNEVRATQVGKGGAERFWRRNGFAECPEPNPTRDFIRPIEEEERRFDPTALAPDMDIRITLGDFHRIHDQAGEVEERLKNENLAMASEERLRQDLQALLAGQHLTENENGSDMMYAHSYSETIARVEAELTSRNS